MMFSKIQIESILQDYAEYNHEKYSSVKEKQENFKAFTEWEFNNIQGELNKLDGQHKFYNTSKNYIYDLLSANPDQSQSMAHLNTCIPDLFTIIKGHSGRSFMEFGAGIGLVCQIVNEQTAKRVTYVDIETPIVQFAKWRFEKYPTPNKPIEMMIISQDDFEFGFREWSMIYTNAVWEHLDPVM